MYKSIEDLPAEIRNELPEQARELYRAAYNRILEKETAGGSEDKEKRRQQAHEGAMLAVESEFSRNDSGEWERSPIGEQMDRKGKAAPD